ncbi:hypothetical protein [Bacteroides pyogenes]|uniref:hypothetical protein n=1 Tax=Bacteroides pyogenes TaxID=310300 RepID=UPI001F323705|nr:hypothetical protein [Bacteroides pyogenes]MCF2709725.1 hypothetical protein [Bacteroides pyogenes]
MNKRIIILLLLVCTSASSIFAQTVEDKKKVDIQSNSSVKAGEQILSVEPIKAELPDEIPFFYTYPMLLKNNPTLTNFYRVQQNRIYKQLSLVGSGEKRSYIGLGEYISLNGAIRWMPSKRMSIDAGGMFSRQFYFASPLFRQDIMGVNTRIQYALTNNIRLNMWGQYIFPGEEFPFPTYNSMFPHTGVGTSVSVDLKKDAEMSVGAEYQYDNKSQKWKLESSGRVSIGF